MQPEARHVRRVVGTTAIDHVQAIVTEGKADGIDAARTGHAHSLELAIKVDGNHRNLITGGIHSKEPVSIRRENQRALRAETTAAALTTNLRGTNKVQGSIGKTIVGRDRVVAGGVIEPIHVTSNRSVAGSRNAEDWAEQ